MDPSRPARRGTTRNPGTRLHSEWLEEGSPNSSGAPRAAVDPADGAPVSIEDEITSLVSAIRLLDLTTLRDDDTDESVRQLCEQGLEPLPEDLLPGLLTQDRAEEAASTELAFQPVRVAAVCTWDRFIPVARRCLVDSGIRLAVVTAGFPDPHASRARRVREIRAALDAGADEIDAVVTLEHVAQADWAALHDEVRNLREACGPARLKTILRAGRMESLEVVRSASLVCCMGGADFIKTSTGRERVNATLPMGRAMASAIRTYRDRTGHQVGLKAAGGIRTPDEALSWLRLAQRELGEDPASPERFRIGASSLVDGIRDRLAVLARRRTLGRANELRPTYGGGTVPIVRMPAADQDDP